MIMATPTECLALIPHSYSKTEILHWNDSMSAICNTVWISAITSNGHTNHGDVWLTTYHTTNILALTAYKAVSTSSAVQLYKLSADISDTTHTHAHTQTDMLVLRSASKKIRPQLHFQMTFNKPTSVKSGYRELSCNLWLIILTDSIKSATKRESVEANTMEAECTLYMA